MDPNGSRSPVSPDRIDLLVDGSLTDPDRRALLLALDAYPDGWRRCALAFLEAQAWRRSIGAMATPVPKGDETTAPPERRRPRFRVAPIALAAGITLAAFLLGRSTGKALRPDPVDRPDSPAVAALPNQRSGETPSPSPANAVDPSTLERSETAGSATRSTGYLEVGYLNLDTDDRADSPIMQLPVLAGPGLDDRWLRDQPPFVPEDVRRSWEQRGYNVELQRRLVSVQIDDDGRYLTIPVDEVRLREPNRATY